ncbi:hypothetical protein ABTX15_31400 [Micromonospora sp. NPDC094482]|uniref:hypothetical protein n=1 Tax=unclassified Micromonospora TaxID=2617518 RepID=UPI003330D302
MSGQLNVCTADRMGQPSRLGPTNLLLAAVGSTAAVADNGLQPHDGESTGQLPIAVITGEKQARSQSTCLVRGW